MIGYKLSRPCCDGTWIFCGTTPKEVGRAVENEIRAHEGLSAEECEKLVIEAAEFTQLDIDEMPEFEGW